MHDPNRPLTEPELRVRKKLMGLIESKLTGAEIVRDGFGHSVVKFRGKSLALMGTGHDATDVSLALKADRFAQDYLLQQGGFIKTPYIGQHGWVSLRAESEIGKRWEQVERLIVDAYSALVPKNKGAANAAAQSAPKKRAAAKRSKSPRAPKPSGRDKAELTRTSAAKKTSAKKKSPAKKKPK